MNSFRDYRLRDHAIPMSTAWLLNDIAEFKGKQELYSRQSPQVLKALRDSATIQSVESSNRIEGVTVGHDRLHALVLGRATPRDRSEQEVQGYRRALHEIHTGAASLGVTPDTLLHLHAHCQSSSAPKPSPAAPLLAQPRLSVRSPVGCAAYAPIRQAPNGDAGQFKRVDNDIVELREGQAPIVRFRCVPAAETPAAVAELCQRYRYALDQDNIPPLIAIAALVLDFLCIHPFRDGNGRVSRLLTLLALNQHGYEVGRYLSLERLIEESRDDYYESLYRSSQGWHDRRHELTPWFNFLFAVVRRGYVELEKRVAQVKAPRGGKSALVLAAIRAQPGEFRLSDLERDCPGVGREWIRTLLADLKRSGDVTCHGRGPGARWRFLKNEGSNA